MANLKEFQKGMYSHTLVLVILDQLLLLPIIQALVGKMKGQPDVTAAMHVVAGSFLL